MLQSESLGDQPTNTADSSQSSTSSLIILKISNIFGAYSTKGAPRMSFVQERYLLLDNLMWLFWI